MSVWTVEETKGNGSADAAVEKIVRRLAAATPRPSGIFVACDQHLPLVFQALRRSGLEPQRDVALIGCNNDPATLAQMSPRPASVDLRLELAGWRAAEQLVRRLREPQGPVARVSISPDVVHGETPGGAVVGAKTAPQTVKGKRERQSRPSERAGVLAGAPIIPVD